MLGIIITPFLSLLRRDCCTLHTYMLYIYEHTHKKWLIFVSDIVPELRFALHQLKEKEKGTAVGSSSDLEHGHQEIDKYDDDDDGSDDQYDEEVYPYVEGDDVSTCIQDDETNDNDDVDEEG
jgi:hypothetical protein